MRFALPLAALAVAVIGCDHRATSPAVPKSTSPAVVQAAPPAGDWPLFRGDPAARGVAQSPLPENPQLLWKFKPEETTFEATAIIVGDMVFVGDGDRAFHAVALADGQRRWSTPVDQGFVAAAAFYKDRVLVGDTAGIFHCFDARDGHELWHFATGAEINSSPNLFEDSVLFGSQDGSLYRLRSSDGSLIWKYSIKAEGGIQSSPTLSGGNVLFAGCDGNLHVVDVAKGTHRASLNLRDPTLSSAAIRGDRAYFGTEGGNFLAVDWQLPKLVWTYRHPRGDAYRSSAAVTDDLIVVGGRSKTVEGLRRADGEPRWSFTTGGRVDSSPVVAGDRVYFGSADGRVYGLTLAKGHLAWKYNTGGGITASPAIAQGRLVMGNENGTLYCFGVK